MINLKKKELSINIKKNLLDIKHQKFLQYYTITIIVIFTYIIGLIISFLTKQIDYKNVNHVTIVSIISIILLSIAILPLLKFKSELNDIPNKIKNL